METNIFLAPMSGCTDLAFRLIAREYGAGFCFFEMLDSNTLSRSRRKTSDILKTAEGDNPIAAQLLGADPSIMLDAAKRLIERADISFLDINSACPVKKVLKKGAGAGLIKNPDILYKIVEKLASSLPIPVTVKIRIGLDKKDPKAIMDIAKKCGRAGASAIFVHGRTAEQGYSGDVDYQIIREIKNASGIPIFGTGNILTGELAKRMFDETGCDGILVARGALGNPWIFKDIECYMKTGKAVPPKDMLKRKEVLKRHLNYIERYKDIGQRGKIGYMRKVVIWYLKGFPKAARMREEASRAKKHTDFIDLLER